jgi:hypothetical protein
VGRKAAAAGDPILVDDAQRAEILMLRVVIITEGEGMFGVEPTDLGCAAVVGFT